MRSSDPIAGRKGCGLLGQNSAAGHAWPRPHCHAHQITKQGRDEHQRARQRYRCLACRQKFDDLTGTVFAGHHQPLRVWVAGLYLMGLNLSNRQIAHELDINEDDAQQLTQQLRQGVVAAATTPELSGTIEIDEVCLVAGHKGQQAEVQKRAFRSASTA